MTCDWTSDGKGLTYSQIGVQGRTAHSAPANPGFSSKLPLEFVSDLTHAPDGNQVAFTRNYRHQAAWFHYVGGMQNQVWVGDLGAKRFRKATSLNGTNEFPYWCGGRIYFVNESEGKFSIYSIQPDGSGLKRAVGPYDVEIRDLQGDQSRLI